MRWASDIAPTSRRSSSSVGWSCAAVDIAINPAYTLSRARAGWTARSDDPTYLAGAEPVLDGMRKAGVPEQ